MLHTPLRGFLTDDPCRLNTFGSADACSVGNQHAANNSTDETLDLGVHIVYSCVYRTSRQIVTTCSKVSPFIGSLW